MRIVGVHGVGQHRHERGALTGMWRSALERATRRAGFLDFTLVYYADLFEAHRAYWKAVDDDRMLVDTHREPEVAELLLEWAAALDGEFEPVTGANEGGLDVSRTPLPVQRAVHRLTASAGLQDLGLPGLRRLARHLYAYLSHADAREMVLERLSEELATSDDDAVMLIGHSMGSVVCYEWLVEQARSGRSLPAVTLVTLGSPLGCAQVLSRLRQPPAFPGSCLRWVNVAGWYDPIACPKRLAPLFGEAITDLGTASRLRVHGIRTYLGSESVASLVVEAAKT